MRLSIKLPLLLPAILICVLSLSVLYSTAPNQAVSQLKFLGVGLGVYLLITTIGIGVIAKNAWAIFFFCLLINLIPVIFGPEVRGSRRWIYLGPFNFQTSELLKFAFIIYLSKSLSKININRVSLSLIFFLLGVVISIFLIFLEPDLGTAVVLLLIFGTLLIFSEIHLKRALIMAFSALIIIAPLWFILKDYQKERITSFLNPAKDTLGTGYNVSQAQIAIGSGGLLGKGFGMGSQSHLRFLPESHTDFIFASFAEEWGIAFCFILLGLYGIIFLIIVKTALSLKDMFGVFLCLGIASYFYWQCFINIGMNLGLLPVTGIPLPLMSSGGSSLVTSFAILGLVPTPKQINS
ncbi:rod shape-determining protein RodA [candidate division WWE3 bacterium CG08_land_8_20_14_0_20_40_13]|uniref:Rod shape-determining protein RodA n=1 Tax=candidate division WWE3 bacterium CG08_land_8_20_14_0_20_40_13 TaxID=1975084 RepID=A0A2H0XFR0_UNCKA|nr:MAG: rod shape-determining protein RodA [candidate division WWE3 bacterium CG08_land_8_20_14_0_20_40_13]